MSVLPFSFRRPVPLARSMAITALLCTTLLAAPLTAAIADSNAGAAEKAVANKPTAETQETVEQRITSLHASLKITPDEDANWNAVAQAMRENASAMDKLVAERSSVAPDSRTALDDLKGYEKFAQAHVDGLKNLISSFETLYSAMPDAQKKIADSVFQGVGQKGHAARS